MEKLEYSSAQGMDGIMKQYRLTGRIKCRATGHKWVMIKKRFKAISKEQALKQFQQYLFNVGAGTETLYQTDIVIERKRYVLCKWKPPSNSNFWKLKCFK